MTTCTQVYIVLGHCSSGDPARWWPLPGTFCHFSPLFTVCSFSSWDTSTLSLWTHPVVSDLQTDRMLLLRVERGPVWCWPPSSWLAGQNLHWPRTRGPAWCCSTCSGWGSRCPAGELLIAESGPGLRGGHLAWCWRPCTCGGGWCWGKVGGSAFGWVVSEVHEGRIQP